MSEIIKDENWVEEMEDLSKRKEYIREVFIKVTAKKEKK